ncbi:hypothetical protein M2152_000721 [Microbacteriaceae bacterium SG_E_30_P1]|uniref:DUF2993 domain-containing protein n=1 Tax=Antiquaquibacter oligotrophicus TaxID=2880260 RepID=A0ABT6KKK9_9MICO|nr:DUF2993 domain-containing protein [Antiquaquibacter oligotrophicus]MDH6180539.1 hypothetical protein [Antiquaquibacter oligotrophicus]UDF13727.1 DUF2993 domain-containing protein [Antiquaquibacter oligotrophicus]
MTEPLAAREPGPTIVVPAPRRKRRGVGVLIGLLVVVVLLAVAAIVGESLARAYAQDYVRDRILESLPVDPSTPIDVRVGGGPVLLQALAGRMTEIDATIPEFVVGGVSGSAEVSARGIPLDETQPTDALRIDVRIPESGVQTLSSYLSGIDLESIELGGGLITVTTTLDLVLVQLPVSIGLAPSAADGGIAFSPETITLEGQAISVDDLRSNPLVSSLAGSLLNSQTFCIADSLPAAFSVTDVAVEGSDLVATIEGDGIAFGDPALLQTGTCP